MNTWFRLKRETTLSDISIKYFDIETKNRTKTCWAYVKEPLCPGQISDTWFWKSEFHIYGAVSTSGCQIVFMKTSLSKRLGKRSLLEDLRLDFSNSMCDTAFPQGCILSNIMINFRKGEVGRTDPDGWPAMDWMRVSVCALATRFLVATI